MPANCSVCREKCEDDKQSIKCAGNCGNMLHIKCVPIQTRESKKKVLCDVCRSEKDPSSIGSSKTTPTSITKEFLVKTLEAFKQEMFEELKNYSKQFSEFKESLDFFSTKIDTSNNLMDDMRKELRRLKEENSELRKENAAIKMSNTDLEMRMRNLEQYSRQTNVEISGVPQTNNENIDQLLTDVAKAIEVDVKKESVVAAHRVPSYNNKRAPSIVVKFLSRKERDEWIVGFKRMRPLTADKINPNFAKDKVFINEHLSPANKLLLSRTKEAAREKGYKYVWSKDGKILIRKESGERIIRVENESALNKL